MFADDSNITSIGCYPDVLNQDLKNIEDWLKINKLSLNIAKTCQLKICLGKCASKSNSNSVTVSNCVRECASNTGSDQDGLTNCTCLCNNSSEVGNLNSKSINVSRTCKYLGIHLDDKLFFISHAQHIKEKLGKQCGIMSKLRYYVPPKILLEYYKSNIKPLIQYGILVYGCTNYSTLEPILIMQKKIIRIMTFAKWRESVNVTFEKYKILTVYELYIYELLKFVIRSLNKMHEDEYLNELFAYEPPSKYATRRSTKPNFKHKKKFERTSIKFRGVKLFNVFMDNSHFPTNIQNLDNSGFYNLVHTLRETYILSNLELVRKIFDK